MSSTIEDVKCPKCCGYARIEYNNKTQETHILCAGCGYDSDDDSDYDELDTCDIDEIGMRE